MKIYQLDENQIHQLRQCEVVNWHNELMILAQVHLIDGRIEPAVFTCAVSSEPTTSNSNFLNDLPPSMLRFQRNRRELVVFEHPLILPSSTSLPFDIFQQVQMGDYSAGPWTDCNRFGLKRTGHDEMACTVNSCDRYIFVKYPEGISSSMIQAVVPYPQNAKELSSISPCHFEVCETSWEQLD